MFKRNWSVLVTIALVAVMLLSGCAGPATVAPTAAPGNAAAPTAAATAAPAKSAPTGTIVVGVWQEPKGLIGPIFYEAHTNDILDSMYLAPVSLNEKDELVPVLLSEIPTVANGGVSADGKKITLRFKDGFKWEDGQPVTSEDFKFTWQFIMNPDTKAQTTAGWNQIDSVDTPDKLTAVVNLKEAFVPFVATTLTFPVLPKHALEGVKDPANSAFARKPVGNGPFMFKEWVPGDHITVVANPNCPIQPKVQSIVFKFVPDVNTLVALIRTGDVDVAYDLGEAQASEIKKIDGVKLISIPGVNIERYYFNLRDPKDLSKPHPIFSDINVRKAIAMGMDRFTACKTVLQGFGKPAVTEVDNTPWANTDLAPVPYDPEAAKKLLDDAGWKVGPTGIREKNGVKLSFRHSTTAGNQTRENLQLLFQQNLKDIGVEMVIQNYPAATLFGGCSSNGVFGTGNFDMIGFANKPVGIDLAAEWSDFFLTSSIKDCQTNPAGSNAWGFSNKDVDAEFAKVLSELDPAKRLAAIKNVQKLIYDQYQVLYVYDRTDNYAVSDRVSGVKPTVFGGHSYNYEEWAIKQ